MSHGDSLWVALYWQKTSHAEDKRISLAPFNYTNLFQGKQPIRLFLLIFSLKSSYNAKNKKLMQEK